MKVNIVVEPDLEEEYTDIHVREITDEITRMTEFSSRKRNR